MSRWIAILAFLGVLLISACAKKEAPEAQQPASGTVAQPQAQPPAQSAAGGPHVYVHLKDGSQVPGAIVASSATDMVVAGDDGIERKIPLDKVASVEYREAQPEQQPQQAARESAPARTARQSAPARPQAAQPRGEAPAAPAAVAGANPMQAAVTTRTYELPAGSQLSVRMDEGIDSATAKEGQTFEASVTRDAKDANGEVVIPRGAKALVIIKSASKGGRFKGASDLVLDMQSVTIDGKQYAIETSVISQKGKSGVGANKRTATYTGGGAALGAIIGAIAGGGKGAAIGAGAGAGAGVLTQVMTKGGSIKVPVESVLTFSLDKPLIVRAVQ